MVVFKSHPDVIQAGVDALLSHANGMSSVRFICGTNVSLCLSVSVSKSPYTCIPDQLLRQSYENGE